MLMRNLLKEYILMELEAIDKIKKLLKLATNNPSEKERQVAMRRAEAMAQKYGYNIDDLMKSIHEPEVKDFSTEHDFEKARAGYDASYKDDKDMEDFIGHTSPGDEASYQKKRGAFWDQKKAGVDPALYQISHYYPEMGKDPFYQEQFEKLTREMYRPADLQRTADDMYEFLYQDREAGNDWKSF